MEEILYTVKLNARDKALLEFMIANYRTVHKQETDQSVIDYNLMVGTLENPAVDENEEA